MDTEEAQEFSKEIAEKAMERELKKQKYEQYQRMKQTSNYQVPKSITIPVPDLNKPRQEKEGRPTSVLSNFDVPLYEEVLGPREGQPIRRSMSVTPGLTGMKCGEGVRPKDSSNRVSAFQDYTSAMMSALNNERRGLQHPLGQQSHSWCIYQHQGLQWVILKQKRSRMKCMFP